MAFTQHTVVASALQHTVQVQFRCTVLVTTVQPSAQHIARVLPNTLQVAALDTVGIQLGSAAYLVCIQLVVAQFGQAGVA